MIINDEEIDLPLKEIIKKITLETEFPVALDSPDHLYPRGTINDNNGSKNLIDELKEYLGRSYSFLDLGCAGGAFASEAYEAGNIGIGLEGSDRSMLSNRASWASYGPNNEAHLLYTCDIGKPFQIKYDNEPLKFDCVSSWEVLEHINPNELDQLMQNISNHMHSYSIFIGSVSMVPDPIIIDDVKHELHQSVFDEDHWKNNIFSKYFDIYPYNFNNKSRQEPNSFYVTLKRLKQ